MSNDQQIDLIDKFYSFVPDDTTYQKPSNAGMKHADYGKNKRRVHLPEPELFSNRIKSAHPEKEPRLEEYVQLSETNSNESIVNDEVIDYFDPDREIHRVYEMVNRDDEKHCPKSVKRCQSCLRAFIESDIVIKTSGERTHHCTKTGKEKNSFGNLYLHFLTKCLKQYESNFKISQIYVPSYTAGRLSINVVRSLKEKGLKLPE